MKKHIHTTHTGYYVQNIRTSGGLWDKKGPTAIFNQHSVASSYTLQLHKTRAIEAKNTLSWLLWLVGTPRARHPFGTLSIIIPHSFKKKEHQVAFVKWKVTLKRADIFIFLCSCIPSSSNSVWLHKSPNKTDHKPKSTFQSYLTLFFCNTGHRWLSMNGFLSHSVKAKISH